MMSHAVRNENLGFQTLTELTCSHSAAVTEDPHNPVVL